MSVLEYLQGVRDQYVDGYRKALRDRRGEGAECFAEVWMEPNVPAGQPRLPHPICVDILIKGGEKPEMVMVASQSVEGPLTGTMRIGEIAVKVYSIRWEDLSVWSKQTDPDWGRLDSWKKKWMDVERSGAADEDGLCGVAHYLGRVTAEGGGFVYQMDFGSAPLEALIEFLEALADMGATEIELGRSDGSDFSADIQSELRQADLTMDALAGLVARLISELPEIEKVERLGTDHLAVHRRDPKGIHDVYLGNLHRQLQRTGVEARAKVMKRFIRAQRELPAPTAAGDLSQLRAVIRDERYLENIKRLGKKMIPPMKRKLTADLWSLCVWDQPNGMRFVAEGEGEAYGLSDSQMLDRGLKNFLEARPTVDIAEHGPLLVAQTHDDYDSSLLLDDGWVEEISKKVAGELVACVPARNLVLIGGTGRPGTVQEMQTVAQRIEAGGDHLITSTILVRREGGWVEYVSESKK